jgi:hypothetical protein
VFGKVDSRRLRARAGWRRESVPSGLVVRYSATSSLHAVYSSGVVQFRNASAYRDRATSH